MGGAARIEALKKIAPPTFPNDLWLVWMKAAINRHEDEAPSTLP
jgi:hypothetical protein